MNIVGLWGILEKIFIVFGIITVCVIVTLVLFFLFMGICGIIEDILERRKNRKKGNLHFNVDTSKWKK